MSAYAIAAELVENGRHRNVDRQFSRGEYGDSEPEIKNLPGRNSLTQDFTEEEMAAAIKMLKSVKAQGLDNIAPEFVIHFGAAM